ncbi:Retrovirus-related Pol polyprotein from type-1 retrotransposable element R1 [Araneus ventricosus]|uniref:Retrovirus-related Pol polyprotein from type-1 retrotransposable element R1 n=1 Tax=Araneus ventricosus TaxID=182803 RepID=A0A4Y2IX10_ARAVE|nr:Retrovirus-related Pol polyprotein from type-1 retrotransposable element R1 [Araneus ventricosus]
MDTVGGEIPSTPLHKIRPTVAINGKKELLTILAEYEVPEELKDRLAALLDRMDLVIHQTTSYLVNLDERVQAMSGYEERLRALENAQTFAHTPTFAQKVSAFKTIFTAAPPPPTVTSVVPGPGVPGPSSAVDLPWHTVTSKRKAPTLPRAVQPKRKATSVPPPVVLKKPDVSLQPRPALPAVVVRPIGEVNVTSAQIKGVLEESIHPMQIGVKIISCQPVSGQGVLIRTETPAMSQKLEDEINKHPALCGSCQAKAPNHRRPQIMVYDVPDSPGDRSEAERTFIDKLRSSNNLPAGEITVVFRRKGRGALSHWVLSLAPAVFAIIRETKRLHWGFGSYRFREFCEPLQCFRCFRYGHVRPQCRVQTDLCAKCPGEHPTKNCSKHTVFFQGNLGSSQVGTQELPNLSFGTAGQFPDVYIIQEPYVPKGKAFGLPIKWRTVISHTNKVLISLRNPGIELLVRITTDHVVAVDLGLGKDTLTLVAFYFPPSIDQSILVRELAGVFDSLQSRYIILAGDANVRSPIWGPATSDHRHHDDGGPFVEFILGRNLQVWNDPASVPTFETERAQGWIDVTLSSPSLFQRRSNWTVHRTSMSDHNFITFSLVGSFATDNFTSHPRFTRRRLLRFAREAEVFFRDNAQLLHSCTSKRQLEDWITVWEKFLQEAFETCGSGQPSRLKVPWWDGDLETQRKKSRALRARFMRCHHPQERSLRREIYKRELAKYKFMIKQKSRRCFEVFCAELASVNPFCLPYKLAAATIRRPTILRGVQKPDGTLTASLEETVRLIVSKHFPEDERSAESHEHTQVRGLVEDFSTQAMAPAFSVWEIKGVLNQMAPRKAPGIDGLTVEMLRAVNDRCPQFLEVLLNKCLSLGCFPESWKSTKLVLLAKPEKDPRLTGSYRPICLLSVNCEGLFSKPSCCVLSCFGFLAARGVPQGSCSGPFYWNLVLDTALDVDLPEGCFLQAFADDLVLVIKGRTKEEIEEKGTLAIAVLIQWGKGHKLSFNEAKTVVLPITFGGRLSLLDPIRIIMHSKVLQVSDGCRYLGVWWDSGLTFTEHFKRVRKRVDLLSYRLSMVAGRFFSRRVGTFFRLYKGALEPFVLYGHGAWGNRLALKKIRDLLCSIQRRPLLKLTQAYRTTSTEALQVIAGVLPLDLKAELVFTKFRIFTLRVNGQVGLRVIRCQDY